MNYIQVYPIFYILQRQKNIRHLSWMKRVLERLLQISNAPVRLANVINVLQQTTGGEDQAYLVITKSDLTAPIEEADKSRDNTYSGFNSMLDAKRRLGTAEEQAAFNHYIDQQLAKIRLDNPDVPFLREKMIAMYANPYLNYLKAQ